MGQIKSRFWVASKKGNKIFIRSTLFNNNIFVQLELFRIQETTLLQNKIK